MEFDRFLKYYENAEDLNTRERSREPISRDSRGGDRRDFNRREPR